MSRAPGLLDTAAEGGGRSVQLTYLMVLLPTYSPTNSFACVELVPTCVGVVGAMYVSSLLSIFEYFCDVTTLDFIILEDIFSLMRKQGFKTEKHCNVVRVCILLKSQATENLPCFTAASSMIFNKSNVLSSNCNMRIRSMLFSFDHLEMKESTSKIHLTGLSGGLYGVLVIIYTW